MRRKWKRMTTTRGASAKPASDADRKIFFGNTGCMMIPVIVVGLVFVEIVFMVNI